MEKCFAEIDVFCFFVVLFGIWLSLRSHCCVRVCGCASHTLVTNDYPQHCFPSTRLLQTFLIFFKSRIRGCLLAWKTRAMSFLGVTPVTLFEHRWKERTFISDNGPLSQRRLKNHSDFSPSWCHRFSSTWLLLSFFFQLPFLFLNEVPLSTIAAMNICASVSSLGKNYPDQLMVLNVFGRRPAVCPNLPPLSHLQSSRTVISHPSSIMKADNPLLIPLL